MYKRISAVLFPVVTILLIGSLMWGNQVKGERDAIAINAENQYQRAFHDLSFHMDRIHSEIGNTLAVNSASQGMHRKGLMNVWRITSEAQSEISQLPLTMLPFSKTEEFLSRIANFSYKTGVRDMTKEPLSENEVKTLKTLYTNSGEITKDLQKVQNSVIANNLRWLDVDTALSKQKEHANNTIIDGFKSVNKKVETYPELDWGPSVSSMYQQRSVKMLSGMPVTEEDITRKALKFADAGNNASCQVTENGKGTDWESYTAKVQSPNGKPLSMDFTRNGGLLTSYTDEREVGAKKVSVEDAMNKADQFLANKGYRNMKAVSADPYDNLVNFTFVREQDGVLIYPEKMTVRSALDNGEVIGFQASDFVYEHKDNREIPEAKIDLAEARKTLNTDFKELYNRKALIKNDRNEDTLCYEFGGRINGSQYRLYINADTGLEETVEVVKDAQAGIS
ncbi:spore germination protein [Paenibacillus uliginis N3/975]|uniref:Spore germination protein n=1 Tax=Paenibacillus uliginis N3/975 TaxID=1313296 RepID=A0A1X7HIV8_9BACL|nr:germination protein YpeB [Paenibacillus uliginis]SMF87489.1 spore germination protein [Paenibacillus uliginis N3/975]